MGALEDGETAIVAGRVVAAGPLVESPGGEPCVYWDERKGLDAAPIRQGGERFWVEGGTERVLVVVADATVRAKADRREAVVQVATGEIEVVSNELRDLKEALKRKDAPELRRRRRHLAKVATLLCALKAHARGRVHGKGTLESQGAWIEKNRHLADDGPGKATVEMAVSRYEMTLAPGDEVTVQATFRVEPMPPGLGAGGGYRDRPTCWVAREATVIGQGQASPQRSERPATASTAPSGRGVPATRSFERSVLIAVSTLTGVAALLWLLARL